MLRKIEQLGYVEGRPCIQHTRTWHNTQVTHERDASCTNTHTWAHERDTYIMASRPHLGRRPCVLVGVCVVRAANMIRAANKQVSRLTAPSH